MPAAVGPARLVADPPVAICRARGTPRADRARATGCTEAKAGDNALVAAVTVRRKTCAARVPTGVPVDS